MKIVQTPARFYPFIGGVENYVYNLSKELVKLGQEVQVICAREPEVQGKENTNGVQVERLSYIGKVANTNITPTLPLALLNQDFDIIHTQLPTPWSADWSSVISRIKRKPLVLSYQNDIVGRGFDRYVARLYNLTGLLLLLKSASKIVITQDKYMDSSIYLNKYKNKIEVVPIGVDTDRFRPRSHPKKECESKVLFFLGLLDKYHRYKGLDDLLKALVIVRKHLHDVKLVVVGDGELLGHYRSLAANLGLSQNVEFKGFISEERLQEYYTRCDAFVLPSISSEQEGFGIVLLEAMASGRPVISTDIVGVAKEVRRVNAGRIVRPKDINALAQAALEILSDEELAGEMGIRGRRLVEEKYTWKKIGRDMLEIYMGLVQEKR
jgi:glycosyltransferase involved in cell wall biosynthesis